MDNWSTVLRLFAAGPLDGEEYPSELAPSADQGAMVAAMKAVFAVLPAMSPGDLRRWLNLGRVTANPSRYSDEAAEFIRGEFSCSIVARLKDGEVFDEETKYAIHRLCWRHTPTRLVENQVRANVMLNESMTIQYRVP